MNCKLKIMNGTQSGEEFSIDEFPLSIGRSDGNDIQIMDDQMVSRIHCTIYIGDNDSLYISDLNSTNGTYLNNRAGGVGTSNLLVDGTKDNIRYEIGSVNNKKGTFSLVIRQGNDITKRKQIIQKNF